MSRGWLLAAMVAIGGCGEGGGVLSEREAPDSSRVAVSEETSWSDQVEAVRAGRSNQIRIDSRTAESVQWADLVTGCENLRSLWVEEAEPGDDELSLIASLGKLEALALTAPIDDEGLARIVRCKGLKRLNLPNAEISDEGFAQIITLDELEQLRIGSSRLSDQGLVPLRELPRLRYLHLIDVPITDAGLPHVAAVATLESFYLDGGEATGPGLRGFLERRPDVHFHKDQLHLPGDPNAHSE